MAAVVYAIAGILLLVDKKTRIAAACLGLTVLILVLVVYVPIAVVERASLDKGLNYLGDTLMFAGPFFCSRAPCRAKSSGGKSGLTREARISQGRENHGHVRTRPPEPSLKALLQRDCTANVPVEKEMCAEAPWSDEIHAHLRSGSGRRLKGKNEKADSEPAKKTAASE